MVNECLMFLRKKGGLQLAGEEHALSVVADEGLFSKMNANEIFKAIMTLPEGYSTVFNLFVVEGYSHKEIGKMLGVSENTSKSQLFKAKAMMQRVLKEKLYYESK